MNDTIKRIQRYIERTDINPSIKTRYQMRGCEIREMVLQSQRHSFEVVCLAFNFGMAKGYRAAKAEKGA